MDKKILIVDDDPQVLSMLREVLEEEGFTPQTASNGREAADKEDIGEYDLVISDIRMPAMDGFELLEFLKKNHKRAKVILMTGYNDDYDISDALVLGADDYITKPFDIGKVLIAINAALREAEED